MASWTELTTLAPRITGIFARRHAAAGRLCMLGTLRPDGFPRISPMEPSLFEGQLWLVGMPGTAKFADLVADSRFTLHTATTDPMVGEGDAKVWGTVEDVTEPDLHRRFGAAMLAETGFDPGGEPLEHYFRADLIGASAVEVVGDHLDITVWRDGRPERVIHKH